ncbi:MAG: AAA-like domain-containing protein [Verrucomicrobia bacterium]|nr:AAA-like domain-containing protein [Verrucomicrobiota bacterium]
MNNELINLDGVKVLVVDDIAENRRVLTQTLESEGYKVSAAPSGEVALKIAERDVPDLILLDLLMPGINGFETCRRLKATEATRDVPVIFITANDELESLLEGFEVGAVDFISKPFQAREVLVRSQTHLKLSLLTRALIRKNRELSELNAQLEAQIALRQQMEQNFSVLAEGAAEHFHVSGTLRHDAPCYVERQADRDLLEGLLKGEFCYVLTSRQMGKSSLMARTANRLRERGENVVTLDLTAIGQNLSLEQWYDGLLARIGRRLNLENELDEYWLGQSRMNPVRRFFAALRDVVLAQCTGRVVLFVDELDVVRSLPFETDEFFAAIRECYNRRAEDQELNRLTFCLLGVATPSGLIANQHRTPFNIGRRVALADFELGELAPLAAGLSEDRALAARLIERVFFWTNGHPYLTQRLCQAVLKHRAHSDPEIDGLCLDLFLSNRASERDDNLIFVRERLLRSKAGLEALREAYDRIVAQPETMPDDEDDQAINELLLSGLIASEQGQLRVRNRIYERVFSHAWWGSKLRALSAI